MTFDKQTRRLTPEAGMYLTQKQIGDEKKRGFSQLMYLGVNDTPENYAEWTQKQYDDWQEEYGPQPEQSETQNS